MHAVRSARPPGYLQHRHARGYHGANTNKQHLPPAIPHTLRKIPDGADCVCPALYQRRRDFVAYPIGATLHSFARNHTHSFIPGQCLEILRRASHGSVHDIGVHSCATKVIRSQISYASSRSMQILHCCVLIAEMACCA